MSAPDITVYFLGASRAIRVTWLLEELGLPYKLVTAGRNPAGAAPQEFKDQNPAPLKKSPTIKDGDVVVQESGAIVEYLLKYDTNHTLLPTPDAERAKVFEWIHAAEGTFMLHGLAILYARWKMPKEAQKHLPQLEENMSANPQNDFKWIEGALKEQRAKGNNYLAGKNLTAADIMMQFSVEFMLTRKLGTLGKGLGDGAWPETEAWLKRTMDRPAYKKAVEKSGYTLESHGKFKT